MSDYNGWTNHATWAVYLWIGSTEEAYLQAKTKVFEDATDVENFVKKDLYWPALSGIISDLGTHKETWDDVNWDEILEALNEE